MCFVEEDEDFDSEESEDEGSGKGKKSGSAKKSRMSVRNVFFILNHSHYNITRVISIHSQEYQNNHAIVCVTIQKESL